MRIDRDELRRYVRDVGPPPAPIEPRLSAREEAAVIGAGEHPSANARRDRVLALIRRPAPPEGADAELLALLAEARALPLQCDGDRVHARLRLVEITRLSNRPPEVAKLFGRLGIPSEDGPALVEALLPSRRDIGSFSQTALMAYPAGGGG